MGLLSQIGTLLSLDTLDGQVHKRDAASSRKLRWKTPEFLFYFLVIVVCLPLMFKAAIEISDNRHPNYTSYAHLLSAGWIPGRQVDDSDGQYSSFRSQIPLLFVVLSGHQAARYAYDLLAGITDNSPHRKTARIRFDLISGLVFLVALHGTGAIKLLLILAYSYAVGRTFGQSIYTPLLTWTSIIALFFLNEWYQGYKFGALSPSLAILDDYSGLLDRWHIHFNVTALRIISYNMDYYWSIDKPAEKPKNKIPDERERITISPPSSDFCFSNFVAYVFYTPLYLAGPILTFNNYIAQQHVQPTTITKRRTMNYAVRLFMSLAIMELVLHFIYVVAMSKAHAWQGLSPMQISMLGYFNLHIIWLKLLIPWRFFRLWAMSDGVETAENMIRCMSNNYSALAFWRAWHRSFNRWVVRYIFVPLGGSGTKTTGGTASMFSYLLNSLAVFSFVAIWHDISLTLLTWGWLVVIFLIPELIATQLTKPLRKEWYYRYLCGVGAVGNILMMMAANLVGFCVGVDGLRDMVSEIFGSFAGFAFLGIACSALFVGVQVMFEVREDEATRGIDLRC